MYEVYRDSVFFTLARGSQEKQQTSFCFIREILKVLQLKAYQKRRWERKGTCYLWVLFFCPRKKRLEDDRVEKDGNYLGLEYKSRISVMSKT